MANIKRIYTDIVKASVKDISAVQSESTLSFVFITDLHHRQGRNMLRTTQMIKEITELMRLDFILCGGDISINGPKSKVVAAQKEIIKTLSASNIPLLTVKGNHDDNSIFDFEKRRGKSAEHVVYPHESHEITLSSILELAHFDSVNPFSLYYYVDFPSRKTRVIVLDCMDHPYTHKANGELNYLGQWHYVVSSRQLNWLAHEALTFGGDSGWSVVIASHIPITQDEVIGADHAIRNDQALWGIIKSFRLGESFASEGGEGDFTYQVKVDFSGQGPGTIIGCLFGHVHHDQVLYRDGIPMISTLNACTNKEFPESPKRKKGTITETAFDIMTVDFVQSSISVHRIGAGQNRIVKF